MTMVMHSKVDMGAVVGGGNGGVDDDKLEKLICEQRGVALQEKALDAAIEELLKLEKEARSAGDASRTQRVVIAIIQLCYDARAWKTLVKQILYLSQRPDQVNQAIVAMVQHAVSYLNEIPDLDTRNELAEALNNVSSSRGLQNLCWYLLLTPHESLPDQSKTQMADLNLSGLDLACDSQAERAQKQFQEPTQQVPSPDFEGRPATPPQQRMRVKDMSPSICRAPLKKKPYVMRKPMGPVRRRLFSQATPADVEEFLSELEQSNHQRFIDRYNFDPVREKPLPGRFEWSPQRLQQRPQLTRATSVDSSTEVRKSELASTLSA